MTPKYRRVCMRMVAAVVLATVAQASACAQTLWRDIPAGSTPEQVRKILPDATELEKPSATKGGLSGLLQYQGFQVGNLDFKATFYFRDGKLDRVFLFPVQAPIGARARGAAGAIRDSLTAKYGAPVSSSSQGSAYAFPGVSASANWVSIGVQIKFEFNQYAADGEGFVQVAYIAPQDTGNL